MKKLDLYYSADCPFCGYPLVRMVYMEEDNKTWAVECSRCHAQGPHANTEDDALNLWNERVKE